MSLKDVIEKDNHLEFEKTVNGLEQDTVFLKNTFQKALFPCILTILSANINVFVDGILIGKKLGENALAAINLSLPVYLVLCVVGSFLVSGTAIEAARAIGLDDEERKNRCYSTALLSTFLISIVITVLGLMFKNQVVAAVCSDDLIKPFVMEYVVITIIGSLPKIMIYVPFWFLRLDGKNNSITVMMTVMSVGNVILDIAFIYYMDMGVYGAGLASVIATSAAFIIGMISMFMKGNTFKITLNVYRKRSDWKSIAIAGTPSALNNLFATVKILIINAVLMKLGGGTLVAVFTAVNGLAGFGECISLGVPQAASAMMGVFCGERDNGSCKILIKIQVITGLILSVVFVLLCALLSGFFADLYGLKQSLFVPMLWMSGAVFPGFVCSMLSYYYNMAERNIMANLIIFFRMIVMIGIGLLLVIMFNLSIFSFLLFAEVSTFVLWFFATAFYRIKHKDVTRFLLMDTELERSGKVINFSVSSSTDDICDASERITGFCSNNGMNMKETMRIQLALEEIMTLIVSVNEEGAIQSFDLRAFSVSAITGIRIRYGGKEFDPFHCEIDDDEMLMGIEMIKKMTEMTMYKRTFGVNTLQVMLV